MWIDVECRLLPKGHVYSKADRYKEKEAYLCSWDSPVVAPWSILSVDWKEELEVEGVREDIGRVLSE